MLRSLRACAIVAFCLTVTLSSPAQITVKTAKQPVKHHRSLEQIKKALADIESAPLPTGELAQERELALRRLKAYRYLVEVPYQNLVYDPQLDKEAQATALICALLGRLEHNPPNPGLSAADYRLAVQGAKTSNLAQGSRDLSACVDLFLFDSNASNVNTLGHRRWCLNPALRKLGAGKSGEFYALSVFDDSQPKQMEADLVCYPARGYMPVEYFSPRHAWSVTLNPARFKQPDPKSIKVSVHEADDKGNRIGSALPLDVMSVSSTTNGVPNCIIFQPEGVEVSPGRRYLVEITGVVGVGRTGPLTYLVEFASVE